MSDALDMDNQLQVPEDKSFYVGKQDSELIKGKELLSGKKTTKAIAEARPDFAFALRGISINKIIDCASPLIALVMRISTLSTFDDVEDLHKRCRHEIDTIELELHKEGYDRVTALAFRYCLCSVIDEAVLITPWGENSGWSQNSLLAIYHQETWGGEKFFDITIRLMDEPHRYIDIIEFLYLGMVLGYEGKYRPQHNGKLNLEAFMKEVHDVIRKERGYPDVLNTFDSKNITPKDHYVKWQTPVTAIVMITAAIAILLYFGFFFYTENYTDGIIHELSNVLNGQK